MPVVLLTEGSSYAASIDVYSGNGDALRLEACSGGGSRLGFNARAGATYYVRVASLSGGARLFAARQAHRRQLHGRNDGRREGGFGDRDRLGDDHLQRRNDRFHQR